MIILQLLRVHSLGDILLFHKYILSLDGIKLFKKRVNSLFPSFVIPPTFTDQILGMEI